jgi:hypothetical protein
MSKSKALPYDPSLLGTGPSLEENALVAEGEKGTIKEMAAHHKLKWVDWEVHRHNLGEVIGYQDGEVYLFLTAKYPGMLHFPRIMNDAIYTTINETIGAQQINVKGWKLCNKESIADSRYPTTTVWKLIYSRDAQARITG